MGYGPLAHFKGPSSFWARINPAVVVTSCSSSFEHTMSVHAGVERNLCNIVVSTEKTQNHHQSISNAAPRVQTGTLTPAPLKVLTSKTPTTFSRCATDVSIRSRPPAQTYLKCRNSTSVS